MTSRLLSSLSPPTKQSLPTTKPLQTSKATHNPQPSTHQQHLQHQQSQPTISPTTGSSTNQTQKMPRKNPNYSTKRVKPSPLPTPARSIFPSSSTSAPTPIAQRNRQVSTGIGYTRDGWVLEGRQPGCVLRRELSAETLGHILIEDNLLVLGIPVNPERKRNQSDSEGGGGGKKVSVFPPLLLLLALPNGAFNTKTRSCGGLS